MGVSVSGLKLEVEELEGVGFRDDEGRCAASAAPSFDEACCEMVYDRTYTFGNGVFPPDTLSAVRLRFSGTGAVVMEMTCSMPLVCTSGVTWPLKKSMRRERS